MIIRVEIGDGLGSYSNNPGDCCGLEQRNRNNAIRNVLVIKGSASFSCKSDIQPLMIKG